MKLPGSEFFSAISPLTHHTSGSIKPLVFLCFFGHFWPFLGRALAAQAAQAALAALAAMAALASLASLAALGAALSAALAALAALAACSRG